MGFMSVPSSGGEFKVFVSYNAKAGRWYTKKDGKDEPMFEVTDMTAVFDMTSLQSGYFKFSSGAAPEKASGKLPVVRCSGVQPVTNKHGTNYQPTLEIVGWTERPEALMKAENVAPAAPPAPAPAAPPAPAHHVAPPAAVAPGTPLF